MKSYARSVQIWLLAGVVMIFFQVILGGITRLTGSGLSITKWEIVTGTVPPLNGADWQHEFDLYQQTPQYQKINRGMTLAQFKIIYFWEYLHRLWARSIGFVFLIPFIVFVAKRRLDRPLNIHLLRMVGLGLIVALFGWIMVASGLNDRPWVNAYKLTVHLNLALVLYAYVLWVFLFSLDPDRKAFRNTAVRKWLRWIAWVLAIQLILGGIMSGMKAGLYYPTWPDMQGAFVPDVLLQFGEYTLESFRLYDTHPLAPTLVQFLHRLIAYVLTAFVCLFFFKVSRSNAPDDVRMGSRALLGMTIVQVVLGVMTVVNCIGGIPLTWGVLHQAGAILLLTSVVYLMYRTTSE